MTNRPLGELWGNKGALGEFQIFADIDEQLQGTKYWLFNVYVPRGNGTTTEIDVMLFHDSGIYIFESKNYSGWIFGREDDSTWTQCLRSTGRNSKKIKFFNPLKQNETHIACFQTWAGKDLGNIPIHSIIIFGNRCELKNLTLTSHRHYVLNRRTLPSLLQHIISITPAVDTSALTHLYQRTLPLAHVDQTVKQQHIITLKSQRHTQTQNHSQNRRKFGNRQKLPPPTVVSSTNTLTCPQCGDILVKRTSRQGQAFLGCANYPQCRYTKSI